jgi:meiotic recombination protein REC8, fungi type
MLTCPGSELTVFRYGLTRVYAQQCGYVLHDAETAKNNMRLMFKAVKAAMLDAEGGTKARYVNEES